MQTTPGPLDSFAPDLFAGRVALVTGAAPASASPRPWPSPATAPMWWWPVAPARRSRPRRPRSRRLGAAVPGGAHQHPRGRPTSTRLRDAGLRRARPGRLPGQQRRRAVPGPAVADLRQRLAVGGRPEPQRHLEHGQPLHGPDDRGRLRRHRQRRPHLLVRSRRALVRALGRGPGRRGQPDPVDGAVPRLPRRDHQRAGPGHHRPPRACTRTRSASSATTRTRGPCEAEAIGPMRRMATAEEMAAIILFLCSPAARFINGAAIVADGERVAVELAPASSTAASSDSNATSARRGRAGSSGSGVAEGVGVADRSVWSPGWVPASSGWERRVGVDGLAGRARAGGAWPRCAAPPSRVGGRRTAWPCGRSSGRRCRSASHGDDDDAPHLVGERSRSAVVKMTGSPGCSSLSRLNGWLNGVRCPATTTLPSSPGMARAGPVPRAPVDGGEGDALLQVGADADAGDGEGAEHHLGGRGMGVVRGALGHRQGRQGGDGGRQMGTGRGRRRVRRPSWWPRRRHASGANPHHHPWPGRRRRPRPARGSVAERDRAGRLPRRRPQGCRRGPPRPRRRAGRRAGRPRRQV